jgi:hypothetical protein
MNLFNKIVKNLQEEGKMHMMPTSSKFDPGKVKVMGIRIFLEDRITTYEIKKILGLPVNVSVDISQRRKRITDNPSVEVNSENLVTSSQNFKERFKACSNSLDFMLLYEDCSHNSIWADVVLRAWEKVSGDQIAKATTLEEALKSFAESPPKKRHPALVSCIELVEHKSQLQKISKLVLCNSPVLSIPRRLLVLKAAQYFS